MLRRVSMVLQFRHGAQAFASNKPNKLPSAEKTKHNPEGLHDLRGFEQLHEQNETEIAHSNLHSKHYSSFAAYSIANLLPNSVARWIGRWTEHPSSTLASDALYPAKMSEDGLPLYHAIDKASIYCTIPKLWISGSFFCTLVLSPAPGLCALSTGLLTYAFWATHYKNMRHLVIHAELSPSTEQILYQKVGIFGGLTSQRARISDLEHVTFRELFGEEDQSERAIRGLLNEDVAFRVRSTGQLLFFDKQGIWNQSTLNHHLLV